VLLDYVPISLTTPRLCCDRCRSSESVGDIVASAIKHVCVKKRRNAPRKRAKTSVGEQARAKVSNRCFIFMLSCFRYASERHIETIERLLPKKLGYIRSDLG